MNTKMACAGAGMAPDRFNEMASTGLYPCAPPSGRGVPRVFDKDDVIAMHFFRKLVELGIKREIAGITACEIRLALRNYEGREGHVLELIDIDFGAFEARIVAKDGPRTGLGTIYSQAQVRSVWTYDLDHVLGMIAARLDRAAEAAT